MTTMVFSPRTFKTNRMVAGHAATRTGHVTGAHVLFFYFINRHGSSLINNHLIMVRKSSSFPRRRNPGHKLINTLNSRSPTKTFEDKLLYSELKSQKLPVAERRTLNPERSYFAPTHTGIGSGLFLSKVSIAISSSISGDTSAPQRPAM